MICKKCGNQISDDVRFCDKCGAAVTPDEGTAIEQSASKDVKSGKKKVPIWVFVVVAVVVIGIIVAAIGFILSTGFHLKHEWIEATCTEPRICVVGGESKGDALGHTWAEATCTSPKTCSVCGQTEGNALGHTWEEATCTSPKTCAACGETEGNALGHAWIMATCLNPKICEVCGETEGDVSDHTWVPATCLSPKTCEVCGETEGGVSDHTWAPATCLSPKTCQICGTTEGEIGEHSIDNNSGKCSVCGKQLWVIIDNSNYKNYLKSSYKDYLWDGYRWLQYNVTVEPKGDYIFEDVVLTFGLGYSLGGSMEKIYELHVDSSGYGSLAVNKENYTVFDPFIDISGRVYVGE